jgi:hypothetical protein
MDPLISFVGTLIGYHTGKAARIEGRRTLYSEALRGVAERYLGG